MSLRRPRTYTLDTAPPPPWLGPTIERVHGLGLELRDFEAAVQLLRGIESDRIDPPMVAGIMDFGRWLPCFWWYWGPRGVRAIPVVLAGRLRCLIARESRGIWERSTMPEQPVRVLRDALGWVYGRTTP